MHKKLILVAVGAFSYGVWVGWAITADRFDKKLKEKMENLDILRNKLREPEKNKAVPETYAIEDPDQWDLSVEIDRINKENDASTRVEFVETEEATRNRLQGIINNYVGEVDGIEPPVANMGRVIQRDPTPPFVISREKYAWDEDEGDNYDKITITYYPEHRILLDDGQELIEDISGTVGWDSLRQFGGESGDPNVVFVRNRQLLTDFEVVMDDEALPLHIKYGMGREEFEVNKAAGTLRLRDEDL